MPDEKCTADQPEDSSTHSASTLNVSPSLTMAPQESPPTGEKGNDTGRNPEEASTARELHWLEKLNFAGQFCLVVVGVVAVCIYGRQLSEMKKTTAATQQAVADAELNFRRDERAWIGFSFVPGSLTFTVGQPFSVPTLLINTGKTPAKNVEGNIVVGVFERGKPLDFAYTPGHANYRIAAGTIFPNGSITESFQAMRHGEQRAEAIVIDKPMLTELLSSDKLVIVHGTITYGDIFGVQHWTRYCRVVSNPSLIPDDCVRYNEADGK
jgi:hypothetical protein